LVLWPREAAKEGIGGKATISCLVDVRGAAYDCVAVSESPAGKGFGGAAIGLSQQFQFRPARLHGEPVVSSINVPIVWQRSDGMAMSLGKALINPAMAWLESPTFDDLAAIYPKKARAARIGGRVNVDCDFGHDGRVKNCRAVMETPSGQGFGRAAEEVAKRFMAPVTKIDGKPISEFGVQIPIVFDPAMLDVVGAPPVGTPRWAALPSVEDTVAAFAKVPRLDAGPLRVILLCKVQMGGGVGDCKVDNAPSADQGVAQAAMTLAPHFRLTTWTVEGLPTVGGSVRIPLRYQPAPASTAPAPPAKP
jgi:TonB family protein